MFLDITSYLAPHTSYSAFLKAFNVSEQKGYFPYEYFKSESQLNETQLPPYEAFYSSLKNGNVLEAEYIAWEKVGCVGEPPKNGREIYEELKRVWMEKDMSKFEDYLKYYNILDVKPFVEATSKLLDYFRQMQVDPFKSAISIPGIARQILYRTAAEKKVSFALFSKSEEDLHGKFEKNIVGGASVIGTRQHEVGKTFIRNNPDKPCKKIVGYDANSLYLG